MIELSDALRQFADRIEKGQALVGASQCVVVLARGIQNFNETEPTSGMQATRGSTN
jgi:hypothetical protein